MTVSDVNCRTYVWIQVLDCSQIKFTFVWLISQQRGLLFWKQDFILFFYRIIADSLAPWSQWIEFRISTSSVFTTSLLPIFSSPEDVRLVFSEMYFETRKFSLSTSFNWLRTRISRYLTGATLSCRHGKSPQPTCSIWLPLTEIIMLLFWKMCFYFTSTSEVASNDDDKCLPCNWLLTILYDSEQSSKN